MSEPRVSSAVLMEEITLLKRRLVVLQSCMSIATIRAGGLLTFTEDDFKVYGDIVVTCEEDSGANEIRFRIKRDG